MCLVGADAATGRLGEVVQASLGTDQRAHERTREQRIEQQELDGALVLDRTARAAQERLVGAAALQQCHPRRSGAARQRASRDQASWSSTSVLVMARSTSSPSTGLPIAANSEAHTTFSGAHGSSRRRLRWT